MASSYMQKRNDPAKEPAGDFAANDQPLPGKREGGEAGSDKSGTKGASVKDKGERAREEAGQKPVIPR